MTGNLRVTPEKLISTSQQFGASDNKVNNLTNQMVNIAAQLSSTWAGDAASGYYNKLRGLQADMQKLHRMIQEHTFDLGEMARTFQQAERQNVSTANTLRTNQIV